jgi:hypothetical protein
MREETATSFVQLPADEIWEYLADYDNVVRLGWEEASAEPIRPTRRCSVRYKVSALWEGIPQRYVACLERAEQPRLIVWSTRAAAVCNWVRFELEPLQPSATRVSITLHFESRLGERAFEHVAWELLTPALARTAAGLERLHERLSVGNAL